VRSKLAAFQQRCNICCHGPRSCSRSCSIHSYRLHPIPSHPIASHRPLVSLCISFLALVQIAVLARQKELMSRCFSGCFSRRRNPKSYSLCHRGAGDGDSYGDGVRLQWGSGIAICMSCFVSLNARLAACNYQFILPESALLARLGFLWVSPG